ncbi:MAG: hypothetical protein K5856_08390 [Bacteroidaceae bacterium]|nr:hypothetical protein [Bacteroidaceae bacterium]
MKNKYNLSILIVIVCIAMSVSYYSCTGNDDPRPVPVPDKPVPPPVDPVEELLGNLVSGFAAPFGMTISATATPNLYALIAEGMEQCLDDDDAVTNEEKAAAGWMTALLLVELQPARQDMILGKGYELGIAAQDFSKRIDGNVAFRASSLKYAILRLDAEFMALIEKAKLEVPN